MLSQKLIALRQKRGITQTELSKELNIKQNTYSQYETKNREPDYTTLTKIADYYSVSIDYLLEHKAKETELSKLEKELSAEQKQTALNVMRAIFPDICKKIDL